MLPQVRFQCQKVWLALTACALSVCIVSGCSSRALSFDPQLIRRGLWKHAQRELPDGPPPHHEILPDGVVLDDGLDEEEAIRTGLANNSLFQATVAQLGMAGGDVVQANLLSNPQMLIYFPVGGKQGQYTLYAPIEAFLLRPMRVAAANGEYRRTGDQLVQNGLNLMRDVRNAYTEFVLATEQAELAQESVRLRGEIANVTRKRFEDGDISELETIGSRVEALNAEANAGLQKQNADIARSRLASVMGIPFHADCLSPLPLQPVTVSVPDKCQLIDEALQYRPDYRAACWGIAAAKERSRLSRWLFLRVDGAVDVRTNSPGSFTGGGMRFDLPIFNRNQGGRIRADWELNAAMHTRDAIRDQIIQEVSIASYQYTQSQSNWKILAERSLPPAAEAVTIANKGFLSGGTDYLLVIQTTSQYLDVKSRMLDQIAATRRSFAELERSVGRCLDAPSELPALSGL